MHLGRMHKGTDDCIDLSNRCLRADTNSSDPTSSGRRSLGCAFGFGLAALRAGLSRTRVGIAVGGCVRVRVPRTHRLVSYGLGRPSQAKMSIEGPVKGTCHVKAPVRLL